MITARVLIPLLRADHRTWARGAPYGAPQKSALVQASTKLVGIGEGFRDPPEHGSPGELALTDADCLSSAGRQNPSLV
jgi:hypothetical protein